jgi:hypothetical protein
MTHPSIDVLGMNLRVIADLPDGYKLALHANGPCVATNQGLWGLDLAAGEAPPETALDADEEPPLPYQVRVAAIQEYVNWSWGLGGTDDHPEHRCDKCGGRNITSWYADSDVWNQVAGEYNILCPMCFCELAKGIGILPTAWRLSQEGDDPELSKTRGRLHDALEREYRLQALVDRQAEALDVIRLHGTDRPPAANYSDGDWWRGVALECMRRASEACKAAEAAGGDHEHTS